MYSEFVYFDANKLIRKFWYVRGITFQFE